MVDDDTEAGAGGKSDGIVVRELVTDAFGAQAFDAALDAISHDARLLVGAHQSALSYIPGGDFERAVHGMSLSEKYGEYRTYDVMPTGKGIWAVIFERAQPMRMTDAELQAHPRFLKFSELKDERGLAHPPMVGWLAVPILRRNGEAIGVLQLTDKFEGDFDAADEEACERVARLIAPTFELEYLSEKYARAREDYQDLYDHAPDMLISVDPATATVIRCNQTLCDRLGYAHDELVGRKLLDLYHPDSAADVERALQSFRAEGHVENVRLRVRTRDGETVHVLLNATAICDDGGAILESRSAWREITDVVQAERAAEAARTRFEQLVESAPNGIVAIDADGRIQLANARAEELFGYERAALAGMPIDSLVPNAMADGAVLIGQRKDGSAFPVEISFSPVQMPGGEQVMAIVRDVTEYHRTVALREAYARLERSEERISSLMHDIDAIVWELDPVTSGFTFVSDGAERILGHPPAAWTDLGFWAATVDAEERTAVVEQLEAAIAASGDTELAYPGVRSDGRKVHLMASVRVGADEATGKQMVRGVIVDITESKELEIKLRDVQKLESLGVLAGGIAHDFNNLLTGILGNASIALAEVPAASHARRPLDALVTAAKRAAGLTHQMLAYSGRGSFRIERVDISAHLREIVELLEATIPKKVQLRLDLEEEVPGVRADPSQLQQVFMNLVINGAEAIGQERGTVHVRTGIQEMDGHYIREIESAQELTPGTYVFAEVTDTGAGMDAETRRRIFDPFFTTKATGRGLGLAAVSGIVRGHDGAIKVYTVPGEGTTFRVYLPAVEVDSFDETGPALAGPFGGGRTVLVVDDELDVRIAARNMLEKLGFDVLDASDGRQGVAMFREYADELAAVLLDLTMPEMNGEEVFRELRQIRGDVPVLLSSGYNQVEITQRFTARGLAGFLQKPYTLDELEAKLTECIPPEDS